MICVYGICKDEATFSERFMRSMVGVDRVILCDTGSTDGTPDILRSLGAEVNEIAVAPWRFDLARNMALSYVPPEARICISMDLDEVLLPNWRETLEKAWTPETTMLRYPFIHNWQDREQTIPRLSVWGFKIHSRHGYIWRYPIHETLVRTEPGEYVTTCEHELIRHYPDTDKQERWSRIELLKQAAEEYPDDQRCAHLYGRELWFHGRYEEAIAELKRHLAICDRYLEPYEDVDGIAQTRSTSCRLIAYCLNQLGRDPNEIAVWMLRSLAENPSQREPWIRLAQFWLAHGDPESAYACAQRGLAITDRMRSNEIEEECWGASAEKLMEVARAQTMLNGMRYMEGCNVSDQ